MPMATQFILVSLIKQFSDKAIQQNDVLSMRYFARTLQHLQIQYVPAFEQAILSFLPANCAASRQFWGSREKSFLFKSPQVLTSRRSAADRLSWQ